MSITAYVGYPGSGKSYECLNSVIVPAICKGRRVVSNIYGLNVEKIYDYCASLTPNAVLGELIPVDNNQIDESFFPYMNQPDGFVPFVKPGDLVCLDEVWRFWPEGKQIPPNHASFFAEHRHFVDSDGVSSDIVLVTQDVSGLPRFIKGKVESVFKMTKLKVFGMPSRYKVQVFTSAKLTKSNLISTTPHKYKKKIYSLYSSYTSGKNAVELKTDSRGSIFKSGSFLFSLFLVIFLFYFTYTNAVKFFSQTKKEDITVTQTNDSPNVIYANVKPRYSVSPVWKLTGYISGSTGKLFILRGNNSLRYVREVDFDYNGEENYGVLDGQIVSSFSGDKE